jgi:hypothetical protein
MDGSPIGAAADHDRRGRFVSANSAYRAKQQRLAERLRRLRLDYDPSPSQQMLLAVIARHLDDAERARTAERRVRAGNAANRLLRLIPRRKTKQASLPTLQELERLGGGR